MAEAPTNLRTLSPTFLEDEHGEYVQILVAELQKSDVNAPRNIALTGHYGSGKSSVLVETQRRLEASNAKVINLSLPSLGIGDARLSSGEKTLDTTNLIQKEIVKQLLYRLKPSAAPASRYNRLDTFQRGPAYRRAAGAGVALTGLALITGVPQKVDDALPDKAWTWLDDHFWSHTSTYVQWLSLLVIFGLSLGAVVWAQRIFQQRIRLTEIAAGPATVSLSENSTSYFDEYLDEIVYFFQNSDTKIVIFEDLDRFKDPHIFETLRELNLLLNNADQTGSEPIRFVYAIRDSIFEKLDTDSDDDPDAKKALAAVNKETRRLMSTNRTKFFDLVVPMVPFISHRTSRDLISGQLTDVDVAYRPSARVIDLVSVHLTDMRLIKNICNEYDVFRRRILRADGLEGLTPDKLFASIVYKNIYLADYEEIRNNGSRLDTLYRAYRDWVSHQAATARTSEQVARNRLQRLNVINARSKRLGERLQKVLAVRSSRTLSEQSMVQVNGATYTWPQLLTTEFWRPYLQNPQGLYVIRAPGWHPEGSELSFTEVQTLIGESLSVKDWEKQDRNALYANINSARKEQQVVAHASLTEALEATDKTVPHDDDDLSLMDVAKRLFTGADLVVELLANGYIDENYTLYVTQFPGQGSASAMNFVLKSVQPNRMDLEYHFGVGEQSDTNDIDTVVAAEGARLLDGKSVYNIEIFDHLLATTPDKLAAPIRRLSADADEDRKFIEAYLGVGKEAAQFAEQLAGYWTGLVGYLLDQDADPRNLSLISAAVKGSDPAEDFEIEDQQREALVDALPKLEVVKDPQSAAWSKSIAGVLEKLGVKAVDLASVAQPLRDQMIARNSFVVTRSNLESIVGDSARPSLDVLLSSHPCDTFPYVLAEFVDYLAALDGWDPAVPTVEEDAQFTEVLVAVVAHRPELLSEVATHASAACMIEDLSALEPPHWPVLATAHRIRLSAPNVTAYLGEHEVDPAIAEWLTDAGQIDPIGEKAALLPLGLQLLNTSVLEDDTKMSLLGSLRLSQGSITASALEAPAHSLIPRLVAGTWMEDDADAFTCLGEDEWPIKQALILVSKEFGNYVTSLTLTPNELRDMARSPIPDSIKDVMLDQYDDFQAKLGSHGARALTEWAAANGRRPRPEVLVSLASKGEAGGARPVVKVLGQQAVDIDVSLLKEALTSLGSPYANLTLPGRDRPKPPIIEGMAAVLSRLRGAGIVSNYEEKTKKGHFEVWKRHS